MKKFCIKSLSCAAAVAVCLSMTACADEKNTHSDLDMLIADLSTSYLDDDEPEETEQEQESEETSTTEEEKSPLYSFTGTISGIEENIIYITDAEGQISEFGYDETTAIYGADALAEEQTVTVSYRDNFAVAIMVVE